MSKDPVTLAQTLHERKRMWHQAQARLSLHEKMRILLELQRQDLPLLERQRPLQDWERPWNIKP